ncbi:MAG TPA: C-terminal binding protein, partial [Spirochaetota bacterium]|nr:C-terminal binding protein [Spirochaetota bacterium]
MGKKYKIVVTDSDHPDFKPEKNVFADLPARLITRECKSEKELVKLVRDADGVLVNLARINARVISTMHNCRCISRYGVGYDNVDLKAASA